MEPTTWGYARCVFMPTPSISLRSAHDCRRLILAQNVHTKLQSMGARTCQRPGVQRCVSPAQPIRSRGNDRGGAACDALYPNASKASLHKLCDGSQQISPSDLPEDLRGACLGELNTTPPRATHMPIHPGISNPWRWSRRSQRFASSSPANSSLPGSHFSDRPRRMAILAKWHAVALLCWLSMSEMGACRERTQSKKLPMWLMIASSLLVRGGRSRLSCS